MKCSVHALNLRLLHQQNPKPLLCEHVIAPSKNHCSGTKLPSHGTFNSQGVERQYPEEIAEGGALISYFHQKVTPSQVKGLPLMPRGQGTIHHQVRCQAKKDYQKMRSIMPRLHFAKI